MTPSEAFAWSAFLSLFIIRVLADYARIRLHVQGVHIHHFVFGLALTPVTWILLVQGYALTGAAVAGVVAALILSEIKEIILQKWGP